jgi:hypothetical protein
MARKDERFQVICGGARAESPTLDGAMKYARIYEQFGTQAVITDEHTGRKFTAYGQELNRADAS